ncbi:MAG: hypothetical protein EA000_21980 [Oscillatoriales cyanobacterium]|nr:MAG: hypothetical protein EA000_21980 [Oscillatoriales cyanobacterium]TAE01597.1 MAG: hypothetical protein EAZ96_18495 [Oscillatoriales cyanobacterium]
MARYALVIGITEYQSSQMSRLPKAASDAEILAQLLEQYGGFEVKRLPARWNAEKNCFEISGNKTVTAAEVGQELRTLLLDRATKNEALIYFAGHGFTFCDTLGQQKGVLATSDCQVEMAGKEVIDYKYGISLASLNDLIQQSDLSSLVMLLDCCHSGYFLESQLVQRTLTAFSTQRDYYLMAACRTFETAKSLKGEPNSYFTGAVLKGLASANAGRNRRVSGDLLFDYISGELKSFVQEPIRMGWGRCITLVTYPQSEMPASEISFDRQNPYLGLSAFESEQEKYFCGREEAVRILITHLTNSRFIPVIGYSGSGKSSLIKAGLLPQLSRDRIPGSSQWPVASFTPGKHPLGKLVDVLARYRERNEPFVIFIDQFEEVFTLCEDESERRSFIRLIAEEMNDSGRKSRMIIAIRGDFLIRCTNYPDVLNLINHIPPSTYIVKSLGIEELPEAIEKPAQLHGVKFEQGLVLQIARDVAGQPGALPLLQYALKELWRVCIEKPEVPEPLLTKKGYEDIGGVQGALENRANVIYECLSEGDRLFVRKLFMELVQLGEGTEVTRRRVDWGRVKDIADSTEQLERVIGLLAGAQQRLIIVDENTVEVAHEALLCQWKLVSGWIEEDLENIRISRRLETACREWKESYGKSDDALLTGARLAEVEEWEKRVLPNLTGDERDFLVKSVGRRDREVQQQINRLEKEIQLTDEKLKAQKQRTRLAIVSGVLLTFTLGLGLLTNVLDGQKKQREAMTLGTLVSTSEQLLKANNQLEALIASIEALKKLRDIGNSDIITLSKLQTVIYSVQERNRLEGHKDAVTSISFSPSAGILASASTDQNIKLWNLEGQNLRSFAGASGANNIIHEIKFNSKNENIIASASNDRAIIWTINGQKLYTFSELKGSVFSVSFSSDGSLIAVSDAGGEIKIWDTKTYQKVQEKIDNQFQSKIYKVTYIYRTDFNPKDKSFIAYAGFLDGGKVKIWNLKTNTTQILGEHRGMVNSVKFSPSGNLLASAGADGNIKIWSLKQGVKFIGEIKSSQGELYGLAFSKDEKLILSGGSDTTIKLWSFDEVIKMGNNKKPLEIANETVKGHKGQVNAVEFIDRTKDDKITIASASDDRSVRIWQIDIFPTKKKLKEKIKLDDLLEDGCTILKSYLKSSQKLSPEEKTICDR